MHIRKPHGLYCSRHAFVMCAHPRLSRWYKLNGRRIAFAKMAPADEEAVSWYENRPMTFQPLVDMDLPSSESPTSSETPSMNLDEQTKRKDDKISLFPSILFTNGAAVLSNQLYHTIMLLLLQSKPRTLIHEKVRTSSGIVDDKSYQSPTWSPLWHAQRVCGIALNNTRFECWDLSLVTSFVVAAQTMTYEPQQRVLLEGFDALSSRMGWNVEHFKETLLQAWGIK